MRPDLFRLATLSLFALASAACATLRPQVAVPPPPAAEAFAAAGAGLSKAPVAAEAWWERFGDPVLADLVRQGLARNGDLRARLEAVEAARAIRGLRRLERLPRGGATASHDEQRLTRAQAGAGPRRTDARSAGFEAGWELDLFGRLRNEARAADERVLGAEAELEQARLVLAAEVARTYFEARGAEARVEALARVARDEREIAGLVASRVELGRVTPDALSRALAEGAAAEAELSAARQRLTVLTHALAVLVAEVPGRFALPATAALQPLRLDAVAVGDPGALLRRRPDVRAAEHALRAAQVDVAAASAGFFPQLDLRGFFGLAAGGGTGLGDGGASTWSAGAVLSWGVLDLGRVKARVRAERAEARAALARYEMVVLRALEDAENAFSGYASAHEQLGARLEQARHAARAAEAAQARHEEGAADYVEALLARRDATAAELARIDGLVGHRAATVAVFQALGAELAG